MEKIYRSPSDLDADEIRQLYAGFNAPLTNLDCGRMCAPHNPSSKPFCCDICQAVPAAYSSERAYIEANTDMWHPWRSDKCAGEVQAQTGYKRLLEETPGSMTLLACRGPEQCQREFRLLSCRQFPFFPYVTSDYRFIGLAYDWVFTQTCWVISHLDQVTPAYREQFFATFDRLLALFDDEFTSYAHRSDEMRSHFAEQRRRIPLLHRNGKNYLISPRSERLAAAGF